MSLKTWKAEFYPVTAEDAERSDVQACEHSLQKWRGALPENLAKHGVAFKGAQIIEARAVLDFDGLSCALCWAKIPCRKCPIVRCGEEKCSSQSSAYRASKDDPAPMIATLEKALVWAKEREGAE